VPGAVKGATWRQLIAKAVLYHAAKGNPQMIKELLERLEGKVTQPISGDKENPLFISTLEQLRGYGTDKK
jgi:hypothetical protein